MATRKTSFWEFIKKAPIEIPIIQRDYAQGRAGKEYLRRNFLSSLKDALDGNFSSGEEVLKLDFVYGSVEDNKLLPLDGQQRLTTLWLLHWFVALKAGVLTEASKFLRNFTYETRMSSREFCKNLCHVENFNNYNSVEGIVDFISRRTWFYSAWKQDPTIQAMLRMLGGTRINDNDGQDIIDGIEELFDYNPNKYRKGLSSLNAESVELEKRQEEYKEEYLQAQTSYFSNYWEKLTGANPVIVFFHQPLEDFGLSDDLYVKMNARGKQLTSFENLKADLIGYIRNQEKKEEKKVPSWSDLLDIRNGIDLKLDTTWMDIFWKNRSKSNQVDDIYLAFINRFFWNELFTAKNEDNEYILKVGKGSLTNGEQTNTIEEENTSYKYLNDKKQNYLGFDPYKYQNGEIPIQLFVRLNRILDNLGKLPNDSEDIPCAKWSDFSFVPYYINEDKNESAKEPQISNISQLQRVVFYAVCKYLDEGAPEHTSLSRWMRVVWNIVSGEGEDGRYQIRTPEAARNAIEHLSEMNSHACYESLREIGFNKEKKSGLVNRWNEEVAKAQQILDDSNNLRSYSGKLTKKDGATYTTWEDVIIDAEGYGFFKGCIRFLFTNKEGNIEWNDFDDKYKNAQAYFKRTLDKDSVMNAKYDNATLLRAIISRMPDESQIWKDHRVFNNESSSWLYYFQNDSLAGPVHEVMMGNTNIAKGVNPDNYMKLLSETPLLEYVIRKIPTSWIRPYHGHISIYPSAWGVFLDAKFRNDFLSETPGVNVDEDNVLIYLKDGEETAIPGLFFGSDICFSFDNNNYQWYRDGTIYLMKDDNIGEYEVKEPATEDSKAEYFSFSTHELSKEDIISKMKRLVEDRNNVRDTINADDANFEK